MTMTVVGTPGYAPYEQWETRGKVGPWTDLYALGGTMVKMITGEAPPKAHDRERIDPYRRLAERRELVGRFGRRFLMAIDRALEVKGVDRWQNAGEWMGALRGEGGVGVEPVRVASAVVRDGGKEGTAEGSFVGRGVAGKMLLLVVVVVVVSALWIGGSWEGSKRRREWPRVEVAEVAGKAAEVVVRKLEALVAPAPAGFVAVTGLGSGGFWMGKYEVTWGEFQTVRNYGASHGYDIGRVGAGSGNTYPVTDVNWYSVVKWCNARSEMEGLTPVYMLGGEVYRIGNSEPTVKLGNGYRLPSDGEWEWAARGGVKTSGYEYSGSNTLKEVGWYSENSNEKTHEVGGLKANELVIYDLSGNVWEWCFDAGPMGTNGVNRGGHWSGAAGYARVLYRGTRDHATSSNDTGFRVVRSFGP